MTPDVNVLVAASRPRHALHAPAHAWLTDALNACADGATLELLPMVAAGFVRLVTNRKLFPVPTPAAQAFAFLRSVLAVPGATLLPLGHEWPTFEKFCLELDLRANQVPDAWVAAAVRANGLRLVTFDAGFSRLLEPSEFVLLQPRTGVQERRGSYVVRQLKRRRAGAAVTA